ncbi:hypothetical protein [Aeropyrum camini]|nr:hypothetical protein [Aeropyrum camini]
MSYEALGVRYGEGIHKRIEVSVMIFNLIVKDTIKAGLERVGA